MKRILAVMFLGVCLAVSFVRAQNSPPADAGDDFGTRISIEPGFETSLDRSYLNDPNTVSISSWPWSQATSPVWRPDGTRIFYTEGSVSPNGLNIFSVPVTGGKPRLEFESIYLYPYNGKRYVIEQIIRMLVGFSPDGKKLYFIRTLVGEGSGAVITIQENGHSASSSTTALECLDLTTGKVSTTIAKNPFDAALSSSGRYAVCRENGALTAKVIDLEKNESWELPIPEMWVDFTEDEQFILFSGLTKMPIKSGERVNPNGYPNGLIGAHNIDGAPGTDWVVYTMSTGQRYSNTYTRADGSKKSYEKTILQLRACNLRTGEKIDLLPLSKTIDATGARISPDGKRMCYVCRNWESDSTRNEYALYVKDIQLSGDKPLAAADAAPLALGLENNYPNPFNPSTTLEFTLFSPGTVELSIFDITGRKVRDLVAGRLPAGTHSMTWDGRDSAGVAASSGTYIARLRMGNYTAVQRMMLVK